MSQLRAFLFAPPPRAHRADLRVLRRLLPHLSESEVIEAAYRRSGGRQLAFTFAQGIVVGALGNLFASALGHFIDRVGGWNWRDDAWLAVGVFSIALMGTMAFGAMRRYRQNAEVEAMFLDEVQRRGGLALDDRGDPDEAFAAGKSAG